MSYSELVSMYGLSASDPDAIDKIIDANMKAEYVAFLEAYTAKELDAQDISEFMEDNYFETINDVEEAIEQLRFQDYD